MQIKNEKLRRFLRRRGGIIIGAAALACVAAVMIIGRKSAVDIESRYAEQAYEARAESEDYMMSIPDDIWDSYFGIGELGLYYDAHIEGMDGEMFIYKAEFSRDIGEDTSKEFYAMLEKKCGKLDEDNFYGEVFAEIKSARELEIVLDLGNAAEDKAITGILRALNEIEGVAKVTVNEGIQDEW